MNKAEITLYRQNVEVDIEIAYLRKKYSLNQLQIKDAESKIKNHFSLPSVNLYIETLEILKNQEQEIKAEGRFLKVRKEILVAKMEKLENPLLISAESSKNEVQISNIIKYSLSSKLLRVTNFLYSKETCENVFLRVVSDWQEEYFEALFKKEIWKARWINVRYTYAFLAAMWQKSPLGDLIEFINKLAK